jgi:uncharacterized membrane protein (DUF4010 family)
MRMSRPGGALTFDRMAPIAALAAGLGPELAGLAVALGIGLMLGVERERRMSATGQRGPAGIRTFALVALLGGLALRVGGVAVLVVAGTFVGLSAIAGYLRSGDSDVGMTTEIALFVAFLLGALAQRDATLAAGAGVAVALVLAYRDRLHRIVSKTLSETEVHDGLLFLAATLIVLPLLPDKGYGPNGALNPVVVWRLVVIVMAIQGLGYVFVRAIGARYGLLLSGFVSGFVSSTATVGTMGARAVREPDLRRACVGAAVASTVATIVLLAIVVAATSVDTLAKVALPLGLAGVAAAGYAVVVAIRVLRTPEPADVTPGHAFDLRTAVLLALTVSVVLLVAGALDHAFGRAGVTVGAAVAGFADSQSAAVSATSLAAAGKLSATDAVIPVLAALSTNTISKAVVAYVFGKRPFALDVWLGLALVLGAAWLGWAISAPATGG